MGNHAVARITRECELRKGRQQRGEAYNCVASPSTEFTGPDMTTF